MFNNKLIKKNSGSFFMHPYGLPSFEIPSLLHSHRQMGNQQLLCFSRANAPLSPPASFKLPEFLEFSQDTTQDIPSNHLNSSLRRYPSYLTLLATYEESSNNIEDYPYKPVEKRSITTHGVVEGMSLIVNPCRVLPFGPNVELLSQYVSFLMKERPSINQHQHTVPGHPRSLAYAPVDGVIRSLSHTYESVISFIWDAGTLIGTYHPDNESLYENISESNATQAARNMNARAAGILYGMGNALCMLADVSAITLLDETKNYARLLGDIKTVNRCKHAIEFHMGDLTSRSGVDRFLRLSPYEQLATCFELATDLATPHLLVKGGKALAPLMKRKVSKPFKLPGVNTETMLKNIAIDPLESGLHGAKVCHGTTQIMTQSVELGPKNIGKGFGGKGLYIALEEEEALASFYAEAAAQGTKSLPIVLKGELQISKKSRIGRIEIQKRGIGYKPNLEKGIFPAQWSEAQELQQLMIDHFDIIEVKNASQSGYANTSNRFFTIHESAGPEIIQWKHPNRSINENLLSEKNLLHGHEMLHLTYQTVDDEKQSAEEASLALTLQN